MYALLYTNWYDDPTFIIINSCPFVPLSDPVTRMRNTHSLTPIGKLWAWRRQSCAKCIYTVEGVIVLSQLSEVVFVVVSVVSVVGVGYHFVYTYQKVLYAFRDLYAFMVMPIAHDMLTWSLHPIRCCSLIATSAQSHVTNAELQCRTSEICTIVIWSLPVFTPCLVPCTRF